MSILDPFNFKIRRVKNSLPNQLYRNPCLVPRLEVINSIPCFVSAKVYGKFKVDMKILKSFLTAAMGGGLRNYFSSSFISQLGKFQGNSKDSLLTFISQAYSFSVFKSNSQKSFSVLKIISQIHSWNSILNSNSQIPNLITLISVIPIHSLSSFKTHFSFSIT